MLPEPRCLPLHPVVSHDHHQLLRSGLTTASKILEIMANNPKGLNEFRTGLNKITISRENTVLIPQQPDVIEIEIRIRGFHGESIYKVQDSKAMGRSYPWNKARVPSSQIIQKGKAILIEKERKLEALRSKMFWQEDEENQGEDSSEGSTQAKTEKTSVKFNALAKPFTPRTPLNNVSQNEVISGETHQLSDDLKAHVTLSTDLQSQLRAPGKKPKKRNVARKLVTSTPYPRRLTFENESVNSGSPQKDVEMPDSMGPSPVPPSMTQIESLAEPLPQGIGFLDQQVVTQVEDVINNLVTTEGQPGDTVEDWLEGHAL